MLGVRRPGLGERLEEKEKKKKYVRWVKTGKKICPTYERIETRKEHVLKEEVILSSRDGKWPFSKKGSKVGSRLEEERGTFEKTSDTVSPEKERRLVDLEGKRQPNRD